jgi:hypothetical protein
MTVSNELIDQLLAGYKKPEDLIGKNCHSNSSTEISHCWHRGNP